MFRLADLLLNPKKAERHPMEIFLVAFIYTAISIPLSLWIFPEHSSIVMVFMSVIACLYIVQGTLIVEEKKERDDEDETFLLKQHAKTLKFLFFMFLGFLLAYTLFTIILPESVISLTFSAQESALREIKTITGKVISPGDFQIILGNNLRVLMLSIILALFYGAGAIFILAWNASIMGFVIGNLGRNVLGLPHLPQIFLKYFIHGIPEMLAYLSAALAGGIIFISFIRGDVKKGRTKRLASDTIILIVISLALLILAALLETFISPLV